MRVFWLLMMLWLPATGYAAPAGDAHSPSAETVIQQFVQQEDDGVSEQRKITEKRKHQILMWMGIALLLGLFTTGALGISMVVFDKQVYVAHMISAGLTITLAVAHAATSIAWFWPY